MTFKGMTYQRYCYKIKPMKKKIVNILLSFSILFSFISAFPKTSFADCKQNPGTKCNLNNCTVNGQLYCCTDAISCDQLGGQNQLTPNQSQSSYNQDPTCKSGGGINSAIGCIPYQNTNDFVGSIFKWAVGIGGGIAFLLIIYSGFLIMSSSGNPERLQEGRDLMTSAISGLILLIFSIFALKVIGIDILGLGAFGFGNGSGANIHTNQINGNQ